MRIQAPDPQPRDDGEYLTYVNGVAYGKPRGKIYLDEGEALALDHITLDDARRLAKAAARVERELAAAHAEMAAPHGRRYFYQGTCQLCGTPADDPGALHAEAVIVTEARFSVTPEAAVLADSIASGQPVTVTEDEAGDPLPAGRCARPGCLHKRDHHEPPDSDDGQRGACGLAWCSCTDYREAAPETAAVR